MRRPSIRSASLVAIGLAVVALSGCRTGAQEPTVTPARPTAAVPTPTATVVAVIPPSPTPTLAPPAPPPATPPTPTALPTPATTPTPTPVTIVLTQLRNDQYDFTVGVPTEWVVYGLQTTLVQGWSPAREALLYIKLIPYPNPFFNISSYTDLWLDNLRAESEDFRELARTRLQIGGLPAMEVLYSYRFEGAAYRARAVFMLAGTMAFFLDGIATEGMWPAHEAVLTAILRSFSPGPSHFPPANP
ncbi:MAG: hypothetical protein HY330_02290 [Chloroflexi bacterium]|nr:hypothetical protein [Chloroflexota bacterium]